MKPTSCSWPSAPKAPQKQGHSQKQEFPLHIHRTANVSLSTQTQFKLCIPNQSDPMSGKELQYCTATERSCTTKRQEFSAALQNFLRCPKIQVYLQCQTLLSVQESLSVPKNYIHWEFSHTKLLKHYGVSCSRSKDVKTSLQHFLGLNPILKSDCVQNFRNTENIFILLLLFYYNFILLILRQPVNQTIPDG